MTDAPPATGGPIPSRGGGNRVGNGMRGGRGGPGGPQRGGRGGFGPR